jgi:uncharacterized lipoprotein YmbA
MSSTTPRRLAMLGACLALVLLGACAAARPTSFYTLSPMTEPTEVRRPPNGLVIGLGPVSLPSYLDRPDIVTREGETQMRLADLQRWVAPLDALLTRIMAEDLYALLQARDVIPVPQRRDVPLDRVVEVDVNRFDADQSGEVVLDARWRVYRGDDETLVASGRSIVTEQGAPVPDYDAIVAAMSRAVGRVTGEIATAISGGAPVPTPAPQRPAASSKTAPSVIVRPEV